MTTAIFAPFGTFSQESGILYLLGSYLRARGVPLVRLSCNGIFSLCDRDQANDWNRSVRTCLDCLSDQRNLARWSGIRDDEASPYLLPEEVERTKRWVTALSAKSLLTAEFDGVRLWDLCAGSFHARFSLRSLDLDHPRQAEYLRRLVLSAARMNVIARRFLRTRAPVTSLVAGGSDFLTAAYCHESARTGLPVTLFRWNATARVIEILPGNGAEPMHCEVLLEDIASMRRDIDTWPRELVAVLEELSEVLGLDGEQLESAAG